MTQSDPPSVDRQRLIAQLAVERAALLFQYVRLDQETLSGGIVFDDWTPLDLLGHVQAWDATYVQRFTLALEGHDAEIPGVDMETVADVNEALRQERRGWSIEQLVSALADSRSQVLSLLGRLSDADLQRELQLTWGNPTPLDWIHRRSMHDSSHAADLAAWRERAEVALASGPKALLIASLNASRDALTAAIDLIPASERGTRLVTGDWTVKDVVGHVVDWEWWIVQALRSMAARQAPQVEPFETIEAWNQEHAAARKTEPWGAVWSDFRAARDGLMAALAGMSQTDLEAHYLAPWGRDASPYAWAFIALEHDLEHAQELLKHSGREGEVE